MSKSHLLWLQQQLPQLRENKVLDAENEQRLSDHYGLDEIAASPSMSLINIILAAFGGLLAGGGIILILAHNWEQFGRVARTILAFSPLILAQGIVLFSLFPKHRSQSWLEVSGALLFCAIPASIAMVGQIYHISDDTQAFLTWWFVLALPFVYFLRAHLMACLMLVLSVTLISYYQSPYWLSLLALFPYYYWVMKHQHRLRALQFGWLLAIAFAIAAPIIIFKDYFDIVSMLALMAGAALMYLGGSCVEPYNTFRLKPFTNIGAVTMSINTLLLTYVDGWKELLVNKSVVLETYQTPLWHSCLFEWALIIGAALCFLLVIKQKHWRVLPLGSVFAALAIITVLPASWFNPSAMALLSNVAVVGIGLWYVYQGVLNDSTSQLNFGLLLLMALLTLRFFDQDLTFIARGVSFILMGLTLIGINVWHSRRRVHYLKNTAMENTA